MGCLFIQERWTALRNKNLELQLEESHSRLRSKEFQLDCFYYDISEAVEKLESIIEDIPEEERDGPEGSAYGLSLQYLERIRDGFKS